MVNGLDPFRLLRILHDSAVHGLLVRFGLDVDVCLCFSAVLREVVCRMGRIRLLDDIMISSGSSSRSSSDDDDDDEGEMEARLSVRRAVIDSESIADM